MNEFELIAHLTRSLPTNETVVAGTGDDCAVLDLGVPDKLILFKTDAVVEGIHFTGGTPPEKIGRKALARCLSDIAAMGGTPTAALITVALPRTFEAEFVSRIYAGLNALAEQYKVAVVGGETTTNPECILISISLLGMVARGKQILRGGAKVGDAIFVTGELGGSLAGRHLDFEPRIDEGRWLAEHFHIHAMLDLSDGLAGDLGHILKAANVGAEILKSSLPVSQAAKLRAKSGSHAAGIENGQPRSSEHGHGHKPAALAALTDGEDFELLFTIASKDAVKLLDAWKKQFPGLKLSCIGKIIAGEGILLRDKLGAHKIKAQGYEHFSG